MPDREVVAFDDIRKFIEKFVGGFHDAVGVADDRFDFELKLAGVEKLLPERDSKLEGCAGLYILVAADQDDRAVIVDIGILRKPARDRFQHLLGLVVILQVERVKLQAAGGGIDALWIAHLGGEISRVGIIQFSEFDVDVAQMQIRRDVIGIFGETPAKIQNGGVVFAALFVSDGVFIFLKSAGGRGGDKREGTGHACRQAGNRQQATRNAQNMGEK